MVFFNMHEQILILFYVLLVLLKFFFSFFCELFEFWFEGFELFDWASETLKHAGDRVEVDGVFEGVFGKGVWVVDGGDFVTAGNYFGFEFDFQQILYVFVYILKILSNTLKIRLQPFSIFLKILINLTRILSITFYQHLRILQIMLRFLQTFQIAQRQHLTLSQLPLIRIQPSKVLLVHLAYRHGLLTILNQNCDTFLSLKIRGFTSFSFDSFDASS